MGEPNEINNLIDLAASKDTVTVTLKAIPPSPLGDPGVDIFWSISGNTPYRSIEVTRNPSSPQAHWTGSPPSSLHQPIVDNSVQSGQRYTYTVRAYQLSNERGSVVGEGSQSITPPRDVPPFFPLFAVTMRVEKQVSSQGEESVTINWTVVSRETIYNFVEVIRRSANSTEEQVWSGSPDILQQPIVDTDVQLDQTSYSYIVVLYNIVDGVRTFVGQGKGTIGMDDQSPQ